MSRKFLAVLLLAVLVGYFGLGTAAETVGTFLTILLGIYVVITLASFLYETLSRRRWVVD